MATQAPEYLYRFCSADDAINALSSHKLPWLSPGLEGDGLELTQETSLNFDLAHLQKSAIKIAISLIFGREAPKGETPLITAVRRWRDEQRFANAEEAEPVLKELLGKMVDHRMEELDNLLKDWIDHCNKLRICRLFEKVDSLENWVNHANGCTGASLRFVIDEEGSFASAKPMTYTMERPEITSMKEQMSMLFYNLKDKTRESFNEKFLTKSTIYKNEKEWRCLRNSDSVYAPSEATVHRDEYSFDASEFKGLYLGPQIDPIKKSALLELMQKNFKNVKCFQMQMAKSKYALNATPTPTNHGN